MQRVVSDSDVIIHLAKLNELDIIRELYTCVHIPSSIELEMVRYQYDEVPIIEKTVRQGVLRVYETEDSKARSIAGRYGIHIGEAHVKVLAEELHAEIFLSNERKVLDHATGGPVRDSQCGFRALNRKAIELLAGTLVKDDFAVESEMTRIANEHELRFADVQINCKKTFLSERKLYQRNFLGFGLNLF